jgi:hypothetical protein
MTAPAFSSPAKILRFIAKSFKLMEKASMVEVGEDRLGVKRE